MKKILTIVFIIFFILINSCRKENIIDPPYINTNTDTILNYWTTPQLPIGIGNVNNCWSNATNSYGPCDKFQIMDSPYSNPPSNGYANYNDLVGVTYKKPSNLYAGFVTNIVYDSLSFYIVVKKYSGSIDTAKFEMTKLYIGSGMYRYTLHYVDPPLYPDTTFPPLPY